MIMQQRASRLGTSPCSRSSTRSGSSIRHAAAATTQRCIGLAWRRRSARIFAATSSSAAAADGAFGEQQQQQPLTMTTTRAHLVRRALLLPAAAAAVATVAAAAPPAQAAAAASATAAVAARPSSIVKVLSTDTGRDIITTASGVRYTEIAAGSGAAPAVGDLVMADVVLSLPDGRTVLDTRAAGVPLAFQVGVTNARE